MSYLNWCSNFDGIYGVNNHVLEEAGMFEDGRGTLKCLVLYCYLITVNAEVLGHLEGLVQGLRYYFSICFTVELLRYIKMVEFDRSENERSANFFLECFCKVSWSHEVKFSLGRWALRSIFFLVIFNNLFLWLFA